MRSSVSAGLQHFSCKVMLMHGDILPSHVFRSGRMPDLISYWILSPIFRVFSTYNIAGINQFEFDGPSFKLASVLQQSSYRGPLPSSFGLLISIVESD